MKKTIWWALVAAAILLLARANVEVAPSTGRPVYVHPAFEFEARR